MTKTSDEVLFVAKYYSYRLLFWESESTIDMNDMNRLHLVALELKE